MQPNANPAPSLTVSELTRDAKTLLESHFDWVSVEGEIGDFTAASSGHWYFTLKDASAQVRCAMFRRANARVKPTPARGDHVRIRARVSLYEARGEFQLICEHLAPAGDGALQLAFERLKQRLSDEGLFAQSRKQPLPTDAQKIGVVTSSAGAAIHDILSVLQRRSPRSEVLLYPVPVQGSEAAPLIAAAIARANTFHADGKLSLDVLIVGRGGGSLEDLWAFNEEVVARAIAASAVPVVSAVGHEVDFSIADFVADYRAPTPSAAAEVVTTDQREWQQRFDQAGLRLTQLIKGRIDQQRQQLGHLRSRLRHPGYRLAQRREQLEVFRLRLHRATMRRLDTEGRALGQLRERLLRSHPQRRLSQTRGHLNELGVTLKQTLEDRLRRTREQLAHRRKLLETLGPQNTLNRGYAIVTAADGKALKRSVAVAIGDDVQVRLASGRLAATVIERED